MKHLNDRLKFKEKSWKNTGIPKTAFKIPINLVCIFLDFQFWIWFKIALIGSAVEKSATKSIKESNDDNWYKLKMLNEMLDAMEEDEYNIPKLAIYDVTPHISLDEGAIKALIKYYK